MTVTSEMRNYVTTLQQMRNAAESKARLEQYKPALEILTQGLELSPPLLPQGARVDKHKRKIQNMQNQVNNGR